MEKKTLDVEGVLSRVNEILAGVDVGVAQMETYASAQGGEGPSGTRLGLEELLSPTRDAFVDVQVSEDRMTVTADFFPPLGAGHPLGLDDLEAQLTRLGIVSGLLEPVLRSAVTTLDIDRRPLENVVIAKGTLPTDEIPEHWQVLEGLTNRKRHLDENALTLDFKQDNPFVLVKTGDLLAARFPEQYGARGWDVYGMEVVPSKLHPEVLQPGENVEVDEDGFHATCDGCLHIDGSVVSVERVLVLRDGVSYQTGNISFPGDIQILGPVAAGFQIKATGSVFTSDVLDVTDLQAGGDLVTKYGIVGHEGSKVDVGGTVRAKFVEGVHLQAKGSVRVANSILNSFVQSRDKVVLGDRGVIMGGRIEAQNGIDVFQVGSNRSVKAQMLCGMDFEVTDRVAWAQEQCMTIVKQMKQLNEFARVHPEQAGKINPAIAQLRAKVVKLGEVSRTLALQMDRNDEASIVVRGTIHMGTYLEICHVSFVVPKEMTHVKFLLDKTHGEVKAQPL